MPYRNTIRNFQKDGIYHIYNKRDKDKNLFLDEEDYKIFYYYLYIYAAPIDLITKTYPHVPKRFYAKNLSSEVEILSYCLMPDHFHLFIKQNTADGITKLIRQLMNAYTAYFNTKHNNHGSLTRGRFRSIMLISEDDVLEISRYIHLNPRISGLTSNILNDKWSSISDYVNNKKPKKLVKTQYIVSRFKDGKEYIKFLEDYEGFAREINKIKHLALEPITDGPLK